MSSKFSKKYESEWKIYTPANPTDIKSIKSPPFSPLPDYNIKFCFEALYLLIRYEKSCSYVFKLKLVKLISAFVSPTLEVSVDVQVNYSDRSLFVEYNLSPRNVSKMNDVTFDDVVQKPIPGRTNLTHCRKMACNTLILKCSMTFSDQHQASYITTANDTKLSKYAHLVGNLKSVYQPSVLSDITFKVGDRSFPAHKVILAAHSPVFMKMMTQELLGSKPNTVTITDAKPEIFDSFLMYLYSGEICNKSLDSLKELFYLANKYDVGFLKKECIALIISYLSVDLVCDILEFAHTYLDSGLKTAAINFAINHINEIVSRDDWKELVKSKPMIGYEVTVNFIPK